MGLESAAVRFGETLRAAKARQRREFLSAVPCPACGALAGASCTRLFAALLKFNQASVPVAHFHSARYTLAVKFHARKNSSENFRADA